MGHSEGKSMLYLEARCLLAIKGAGSQGVQNGSISCIALPESLPGGVRGVLAENLIAAMLDLELASGNDAMASHSQIRKASKLMLQFLPGADFIFSGYSSMPREDNLFGGGNFDSDDLDDYGVLQRDMQVDGGLRPVGEGGLHRADGTLVGAAAGDPVEPDLVLDRRACREPAVAIAELVQRQRTAADELVQALVVQHVRHLVGVLRSQGPEQQPPRRDLGRDLGLGLPGHRAKDDR